MTLAGFEQRWRRTTRAQYGVLALVSNITLAAVVFLVVLAPLYFARRRRDRRRLETMRDADAAAEKAEQAERDSALRALLGESELKDGT
jgi:type II secretory pathway component PulM